MQTCMNIFLHNPCPYLWVFPGLDFWKCVKACELLLKLFLRFVQLLLRKLHTDLTAHLYAGEWARFILSSQHCILLGELIFFQLSLYSDCIFKYIFQ